MDMQEYAALDGVGIAGLIRSGEVTAAEVEAVARQSINEANIRYGGLVEPFEPALDHAAEGPFAGVPFLIKDTPMAAGRSFSMGSRAIPSFVTAARDSELMRRFRAAGLVTLGRTAMDELGLGFATPGVRNPFGPERGVGGSSGGSAALVAAGAVPMAHGNDGAGSLRVPAACCGLVGLKPSRGRVPSGPEAGEGAFGLLYDFALTRTVRDAAHLLDAVHGMAPGDKYTAPPPARPYAEAITEAPPRLRVAVTTTAWNAAPVDAEVAAATERAGRLLEKLGHVVEAASPAIEWDLVHAGLRGEVVASTAPLLMAPRRPDPADLRAVARAAMQYTDGLPALELMRAFAAHNAVARAVGAFFTGYDLLVTPVLAQPPLAHGVLDDDDIQHTLDSWLAKLFEYGPFTAVFNIAGQPAVSLPLGRTTDGLPIGVQVVAGYGRDDLLLQIAAALEPEFRNS